MKSLHTFTVVIVADCTKQEAASYVRDAVRSWGGSHEPSSPFFGLGKRDAYIAAEVPTDPKERDAWHNGKWAELVERLTLRRAPR